MISNNPSRYNDLKVLNSSRISEAPYMQPLSLTCGKLPRPQSQTSAAQGLCSRSTENWGKSESKGFPSLHRYKDHWKSSLIATQLVSFHLRLSKELSISSFLLSHCHFIYYKISLGVPTESSKGCPHGTLPTYYSTEISSLGYTSHCPKPSREAFFFGFYHPTQNRLTRFSHVEPLRPTGSAGHLYIYAVI